MAAEPARRAAARAWPFAPDYHAGLRHTALVRRRLGCADGVVRIDQCDAAGPGEGSTVTSRR
jgi:hypothetical protein